MVRTTRSLHPGLPMRYVGVDSTTGRSTLDQDWTALDPIAWTRGGRGKVSPERRKHDITVVTCS